MLYAPVCNSTNGSTIAPTLDSIGITLLDSSLHMFWLYPNAAKIKCILPQLIDLWVHQPMNH